MLRRASTRQALAVAKRATPVTIARGPVSPRRSRLWRRRSRPARPLVSSPPATRARPVPRQRARGCRPSASIRWDRACSTGERKREPSGGVGGRLRGRSGPGLTLAPGAGRELGRSGARAPRREQRERARAATRAAGFAGRSPRLASAKSPRGRAAAPAVAVGRVLVVAFSRSARTRASSAAGGRRLELALRTRRSRSALHTTRAVASTACGRIGGRRASRLSE